MKENQKNNFIKTIKIFNIVIFLVLLIILEVCHYVSMMTETRLFISILVAAVGGIAFIAEIIFCCREKVRSFVYSRVLIAMIVLALGEIISIILEVNMLRILSKIIVAAILFVPLIIKKAIPESGMELKDVLKKKMIVINWILFAILLLALEVTCFIEITHQARLLVIISCFIISLISVVIEICLSIKWKIYSFLTQFIVGSIMIVAVGHYLYSFMNWLDIKSTAHLLPVVMIFIIVIGTQIWSHAETSKKVYLTRIYVFLGIVVLTGVLIFTWATTWTSSHEIYSQETRQRAEYISNKSNDNLLLNEAMILAGEGKLVDYKLYYRYENEKLNKEGVKFIFNTGDKKYTSILFTEDDAIIEYGRLKSLSENEITLDDNIDVMVNNLFLQVKTDYVEEGIDWEKEYGTHIIFNLKMNNNKLSAFSVGIGPEMGKIDTQVVNIVGK